MPPVALPPLPADWPDHERALWIERAGMILSDAEAAGRQVAPRQADDRAATLVRIEWRRARSA